MSSFDSSSEEFLQAKRIIWQIKGTTHWITKLIILLSKEPKEFRDKLEALLEKLPQ